MNTDMNRDSFIAKLQSMNYSYNEAEMIADTVEEFPVVTQASAYYVAIENAKAWSMGKKKYDSIEKFSQSLREMI